MIDLISRLFGPQSIYDPPSLIYTLLTQPTKTLVRLLDFAISLLRSPPQPHSSPIRVVCISDTHCLKKSDIPDGDLLIHAGDLANLGNPQELQAQIDWLDSLPHVHKIAIAGNHDRYFDPRSRRSLHLADQNELLNWRGIWYLQHSSVDLIFDNGRHVKVYGAPQTPADGTDDFAFRYRRGFDAWSDTVPRDVDILVTHTPPKYHLDLPAALGCEHLLHEVWKTRPLLHVFGHVHSGKTDLVGWLKGGKEVVRWDETQRLLERARRRPDGLVRGFVDPRSWLDLARFVFHGVGDLLWERAWGGQSREQTVMVLASLMYCNSGELLNAPQVVEI